MNLTVEEGRFLASVLAEVQVTGEAEVRSLARAHRRLRWVLAEDEDQTDPGGVDDLETQVRKIVRDVFKKGGRPLQGGHAAEILVALSEKLNGQGSEG